MTELKDRLKAARERLVGASGQPPSHADIARAVSELRGIKFKPQSYEQLEKGTVKKSGELAAIAEVLGVSPIYLQTGRLRPFDVLYGQILRLKDEDQARAAEVLASVFARSTANEEIAERDQPPGKMSNRHIGETTGSLDLMKALVQAQKGFSPSEELGPTPQPPRGESGKQTSSPKR